MATGIIRNKISSPVIMAIIGFAPAGGWIVFVMIIKNIARPTPRPKESGLKPRIEKIRTPHPAAII